MQSRAYCLSSLFLFALLSITFKDCVYNHKSNIVIVFFPGKGERHVRFEKGVDDSSDQNESEEGSEPKSLQERLLLLAGQAKKDDQVGLVTELIEISK